MIKSYDEREAWVIMEFCKAFPCHQLRTMMIVNGEFNLWYENKKKEWDDAVIREKIVSISSQYERIIK
jgi:hypothetical protein